MKLGRKLKWDPKKEQFIGDDEANKLVTPIYAAAVGRSGDARIVVRCGAFARPGKSD